ncbi:MULTISPECIES: AlwI family type II restriction endonuclease [Aeribacillus]|uniref:AlwI family type II restriction endonuclease n=1 Tax=Aeribacillus TaxID=1055323 RepID=UPI0007B4A72D|nr:MULTISPECIES: AlwI family type II restriction endonuclease [Aeribacillus]KZM57061.1 hypothetical protein A3Q35_19215 [Aeribacillus pallidus]MED0652081.1 AlwI family type II restriction endonuclease [Aeribacillus composti]MED4488432.1 AlwI family type II restriction endonuclease [Aeribacillus pallidus]
MKKPWVIGNTTIRNPARLKEGLKAFYESPLYGRLIVHEREEQLARVLADAGVIDAGGSSLPEYGRKWRSAFTQLGLITHKFKRNIREGEVDPKINEVIYHKTPNERSINLSGLPYEITPSGLRLIKAETIREQQECMLRTILAYQIPSPIENRWDQEDSFSPLKFCLDVVKKLTEMENPKGLSIPEMAIVQSYTQHDKFEDAVREIQKYRSKRNAMNGLMAKRKVDSELYNQKGKEAGIRAQSIKDYADTNFRYLRFTGLFSLKGKRIVLNEDKLPLIESILSGFSPLIDKNNENEYLIRLWKGSELPTDDEIGARNEIKHYVKLIKQFGINEKNLPEIPEHSNATELTHIRIKLEEMYKELREQQYAEKQKEEIKEIIAYLKLLDKQNIGEEFEINIRNDEKPAYLEWAVWRAFLGINHLVNKPYEARRFEIDDDFLPVGFAPPNGPDMIFEFDDYVLVVEVTLTSSSRQEAAEGEPVRRHVAKEKERIKQKTGKPVYGLFLARSIDNNTAETFRIGVWYNGDEPDFLNIIPITLTDFINIMEYFSIQKFNPEDLRRFLDTCLIPRNAHAPVWKQEISKSIKHFIKKI